MTLQDQLILYQVVYINGFYDKVYFIAFDYRNIKLSRLISLMFLLSLLLIEAKQYYF